MGALANYLPDAPLPREPGDRARWPGLPGAAASLVLLAMCYCLYLALKSERAKI